MKKLILILTLLLVSGAAVAGIFGGRSGVQSTTTTPSIMVVAVTPSSFLGGSADGTVVGAVSVTATGGTFSGTVAIGSGGQGAAFRLSSPSLPSNLVLNGTQSAGSYVVNLVPTQAGFTNSGSPFPVTITGTAVTAGCSQATAFLAANPGLSAGYQGAYTTYICGLVADAVIPTTASMASSGATPYCGNKLDALWIMATSNAATANKDICGHSAYTLVPNGSPNFTANQGYLGINGSSTVFLNTGFNPATAGGNFTQNSAHMAIWSMTNSQAIGALAGTAIGSSDDGSLRLSQIVPWYSDGSGYGAVNANSSIDPVTFAPTGQVGVGVSDSSGYYAVSRTSSTLETMYKGNAPIGTNAVAAQSMLSLPIYILGRNASGSADSGAGLRISMASLGAGLLPGDITAMQARGCAYLTTLNGTCSAPQSIASIAPSGCSFTAGTRNGPVCALSVTMAPPVPSSTAALTMGQNSGNFHLVGSACSNISSGNSSAPPSGRALTTAAGTWTWGSSAPGQPGEYNINLNGTLVGAGLFMQVTSGQLYVDTATGGWFVWNGSGFDSTAAPVQDGCMIEQSSSAGGTAAGTGPYTDASVVATQAGTSNSPKTQALTLAALGVGGAGPTPPAQALVANFTTCVICMDFTAVSGGVWVDGAPVGGKTGSDASTWLDCAGSNSPLWYKGVNQAEHSSDFLCPDIVNDGAGNPRVLRTTMGPQSVAGVGTGMLLYSNGGLMAPTNIYIESAGWYSEWPDAYGYGTTFWMGGGGQIPGNLYNNLEYDAFEINSGSSSCCAAPGMSSGWGSWIQGNLGFTPNWYGTYPPNYPGYLPTSGYHTIGMRVTSDGSRSIYKCMWLDGIFQDCQNQTVNGDSRFQASQLSDATSRMQVYLTGPANFFGPTTSRMTFMTKYLYAWSCPSWQTTACSTPGNPDPGGY